MKYILAIVIFGIIILIHEFGHFAAAKLCGIRVNKFALGMGPCLLKKQWGETGRAHKGGPIPPVGPEIPEGKAPASARRPPAGR